MRKIYLILLGALLFSSCGKDFLELNPISSASVNIFYKTPADIENAVIASYASLRGGGGSWTGYGGLISYYGDMHSDIANTFLTTDSRGLTTFEITAQPGNNDGHLYPFWTSSYAGILRCNIVMNRIGSVKMDETLASQRVGEVKFIRALYYFTLVRLFGDVPLVLNEVSIDEAYKIGRTPSSEVYKAIIQDLKDAIEVLPAKDAYLAKDMGRATKGAAQALLGKVYLTIKDYANAKTYLETVITSGKYNLVADYAKIYGPENENNIESIFEIQYKGGGTGTGSRFVNDYGPRNSAAVVVGNGEGWGRNRPNVTMIASYEQGDARKAVSVAESYINAKGATVAEPYTKKYLFPTSQTVAEDSHVNYIILRYADVMLMYAEVLNALNNGPTADAYKMINDVRNRAKLNPLSGLDKNSFALAVEKERKVELAFEGHRWFDLVRTNRAITVLTEFFAAEKVGYKIVEYQLIMPIPQQVIDNNPGVIKQNPNWN